ncbi:MAG: TIGR02266 family protein [Myxococcota bacterium]
MVAIKSSERRIDRRLPIRIQVDYETLDEFLEDVTANISVGGMFIRTDAPLVVGTRFRLRFTLPDERRAIDAVGEVRWTVMPDRVNGRRVPGMGVRFDQLSESDQRQLETLLANWKPGEEGA